jgi:hypothetical protein
MSNYSKYVVQTGPDPVASTREIGPRQLQPTPAEKASQALPPVQPDPPALVVPNYKIAPWDVDIQLFAGPDPTGKTWSMLSAYLLAILSAQAYGRDGETEQALQEWFPWTKITATTIGGAFGIQYTRWDLQGGRAILTFAVNKDIRKLQTLNMGDYSPYADLAPTWYFCKPLGDYLRAAENALLPALAQEWQNGHNVLVCTGHDLGGTIAAWIADRLNAYTPLTSSNQLPVANCYCFGSPSCYEDNKLGTGYNFRTGFTSVNIRCSGDPVPALPQWWGFQSGAFTQLNVFLGPIPHGQWDFQPILSVKKGDIAELRDANLSPFRFWSTIGPERTNLYIDRLFANHPVDNYIATIDQQCRSEGNTPSPLYNNLYTAATVAMSGGGNF